MRMTRPLVRLALMVGVAAAWLVALGSCGDDGDAGGAGAGTGGSGGAAGAGGGTAGGVVGGSATGGSAVGGGGSLPFIEAFEAGLEADGFVVQHGAFELVDLSDCCEPGKTCSGNNPSSPYAFFSVPRAPGQTVANPYEDEHEMSRAFRLRDDEAVIYVGVTPPRARYFGFTPYLFDRDDGTGRRRPIFASLSETLNQDVITVAASAPDVFEQSVIVMASADEGIDARIRAVATAAGASPDTLNTVVFDPTRLNLGIDEPDDSLGVLFRVAVFDDANAGQNYLEDLPGAVLRVTPEPAATLQPFASPPPRPKDLSTTESALADAVDELGAAIEAAYTGYRVRDLFVSAGILDPERCMAELIFCAGDNRDTFYPLTLPAPMFADPEDFYVVYGVNHQATGKATYANASVYAVEHAVGVASVHSGEWAGSAADYLPGHPDAPLLFAWKIARDCTGDPHCTAIPDEGCPTGIEDSKYGNIAFRIYLEPTTHTAPDPSTLVPDRVLRFRKR